MKLIRSQKPGGTSGFFAFPISPREKVWLLSTLNWFPLLDAGSHQLSRNPKTTGNAE